MNRASNCCVKAKSNHPQHSKEFRMRPSTAALLGNLEALVLAQTRYPLLKVSTTLNAARSGSLACMQFAHLNGADWHPRTTAVAARCSLACLEYAHLHGAPWHPLATEGAARGHLACLRYCHEHGAPWTRRVTLSAALMSSIECLKYAKDHGAPRHHRVIETCVRNVLYNPESILCREVLTYAVDACFPYNTRVDPRHLSVLAVLYDEDPHLQGAMQQQYRDDKALEILMVMEVRRSLHCIRVIQRAWRGRPQLILDRELMLRRKRRAVDVIQLAYLAWTCRPGYGRTYKRARLSFDQA